LDEDRVRSTLVDPALQAPEARDEDVVADELHAAADLFGQRLPRGPVVLGESVLDRDDREPLGQLPQVRDHPGAVDIAPLEDVAAVPEELGRRRVQGNRDPLAMACPLRRLEQRLDRLLARAEIRRETALVAYAGRE